MDFKQSRVEDLRKELIEDYGYSVEEVSNIKGKGDLVNEVIKNRGKIDLSDKQVSPSGVIESEDLLDVLNNLIPEVDDVNDVIDEIVQDSIPEDITPQHPKWTEFVLGHLIESEKDGNYPKMDGLRRLVGVFVGEIVNINSKVIVAPSAINGNYACVQSKVTVQREDKKYISMTGCADAFDRNMERAFSKFPTAVAQSRAESRAFTRLLGLSTIAAEEIVSEKYIDEIEKITETQKKLIEGLCKRLDIDPAKLVTYFNLENLPIEELSKEKAQTVCAKLNEWQGIEQVPNEVKYESNL